jgi:hypothetical protein
MWTQELVEILQKFNLNYPNLLIEKIHAPAGVICINTTAHDENSVILYNEELDEFTPVGSKDWRKKG